MNLNTFRQLFVNRNLLEIFLLGILSGMPLSVLYTALTAWLTDAGISIEIITTFAVSHLSYSLKPLWSPLVDKYPVPFLNKIGHRKSWLILCTGLNVLILFTMSYISPASSISLLYFLAIGFGVCAATFDISYDAFRIENLSSEMQGIGSACAVFGYRIGMLVTGAGALSLAHLTSWSTCYFVMAAVFAIGLSVIVCVYENRGELVRSPLNLLQIGKSFLEPWEDFFSRRGAAVILIAIIFFKLGEAMLGAVTTPFYMGLGFSKLKISSIVKLYGFVAATLGTYAGGYLLYKIGYFKGIIISAFAQSITNLSMIWLNNAGANDLVLIATVSMENFTGGMGNTALVSYLSLLCSQEYPATQYALLSSAASLCTNSITIYAGELVSSCGWDLFFILTVLMGIPAVTVFCYSRYQYGELWFAKDKRCTGDNSRGQYKL